MRRTGSLSPLLVASMLILAIAWITASPSTLVTDSQLVGLSSSELKAGGVYQVTVNVSNVIYSVEVYIESFKLGELPENNLSGPLTMDFLVPPDLEPGSYTIYVKVVYFVGNAVDTLVEEFSVTVYREVMPSVSVILAGPATPGEDLSLIVLTTYGGGAVSSGDLSLELLDLSGGSPSVASSASAVEAAPGFYLASINIPGEGAFVLKLSFAGVSTGLIRIPSFTAYTPILAIPLDPNVQLVVEAINSAKEDLSFEHNTILGEIGNAESNIVASIDSARRAILDEIGVVEGKVDSIADILNQISDQLVVIRNDTSTLIGMVSEVRDEVIVISTGVGEIAVSLDNVDARLAGIEGRIAVIESSLGEIAMSVDAIIQALNSLEADHVEIVTALGTIQGTVLEIRDGLMVIDSGLGEIILSLDEIGAQIKKVDNEIALIKSDLGTVMISVDRIIMDIEALDSRAVRIQTSLGDLTGVVESIDSEVAVINTELGTLTLSVETLGEELKASFQEIAESQDETRSVLKEILSLANSLIGMVEGLGQEVEEKPARNETILYSFGAGALAGVLAGAAAIVAIRYLI